MSNKVRAVLIFGPLIAITIGASFYVGWRADRAYVASIMRTLPDDPNATNAFTVCLGRLWKERMPK